MDTPSMGSLVSAETARIVSFPLAFSSAGKTLGETFAGLRRG